MGALPGIGETLREARIRPQVDIGEVERATKIRAKYLRALENEEFDLLPGPTFVRSFLKTYAEHLGLDARVIVEEFRASSEGLPDEDPTPAFRRPPSRREPMRYERRPPATGLLVGGGIAAVLVLFLVLGLTSGDGEPEQGGGGGEQAVQPEAGERRERRERRSRERRARPTSVKLKISPVEPTYVCVDREEGEAPIYEGSLTSPRSFRGRRLRLNLGRPSAEVRVNGDEVDLGTETMSVGFSFAPGKGPRRIPSGQRPCADGNGAA
ncbi:MAG TPA: helix-turn-helix domain-containing protein [Thermoleophilaceae bacterium]|nr:helix-turn-helix domain-containing protein [Thermoleophilaceae bacterium]